MKVNVCFVPNQYRRSEVRQREIAEAALKVIAVGGLGEFTVAALAEELPIAGGTIFRHFRNKEEIVLAAIKRLEEDLFPSEDVAEGWERLRSLFFARCRLLAQPNSIGRLVFSGELGHAAGPEGVALLASIRRRSFAYITQSLRDAEGTLREDVPLEELTRMVIGLLVTFRGDFGLSREADVERRISTSWDALERLFFVHARDSKAKEVSSK